ncbi:hypothetical protein Cgig2_016879 [Carnegiea gigantea]|uniref:Uncharacterized protein n=1 Tax=Carnegiea gigantea TaxID=171969 RepID=A0A9Q1K665_9CARY|nr:hypothetical protein Cgig2_016879 [Carnegiea gigantea]
MSDAYQGDDSYRPFIGKFTSLATMGDQTHSSDGKRRSLRDYGFVRVFPNHGYENFCCSYKVWNLGFWDLNARVKKKMEMGFILPASFSFQSSPPGYLSPTHFHVKDVTSCYNGTFAIGWTFKGDVELVYSAILGSELFSLSQQPNNANRYIFWGGTRRVSICLMEEQGKICSSWSLHDGRINSVDFSPAIPISWHQQQMALPAYGISERWM